MKVDNETLMDTPGSTLTKMELIEHLTERLDIDKTLAKTLVDAFFQEIISSLKDGCTVKLPGLGNFMVRDKVARPGRNMKTGEMITIKPRRVVTFRSSALLNRRATAHLVDKADAGGRSEDDSEE